MKRKSDDERRNLFVGDWLRCQACDACIWGGGSGPFKFSDITEAYRNHIRSCFALKRLLVNQRNGSNLAQVE